MAAIFDLLPTPTSESVHIRSAKLVELENVSVAFWKFVAIVYTEVEILRYFISAADNGGYLQFTTLLRCRRVSTLVLPCWRIQKMWV